MKRKIFREDIIQAGLDIMFMNGYNATGIKEITDKVDIPKGSFYNHFENKESFGLEVLKTYSQRGIKFHKRILENTDQSPLKRLKSFYAMVTKNYKEVSMCKKGCIMGNFSAELADINENFREILDNEFNAMEQIIIQTLKAAQDQNEISKSLDVESIGAFMLNSWHGAIIRMKSTATVKPLEDFMNLIFNSVLK